MVDLWNGKIEERFFKQAREFVQPEQLFYKMPDGSYTAYWPKGYKGVKTTLQSRNSLIGKYTEKWSVDLLEEFAHKHDLYAKQGVICNEIGLSNKSPADVALCRTNDRVQKSQNIAIIFEVKMSLVWNWNLLVNNGKESYVSCGDYTTHQGNPGLLRSDSMLKAIGKSINIRVSGFESSKIPIIILGNTPITKTYYDKVDHLKRSGIIQGFWSVNPKPKSNDQLKNTKYNGFIRMDSYEEFMKLLEPFVHNDKEFFSGMKTKKQLGQLIEIANKEPTFEKKGEKFIEYIRSEAYNE